jgi:AcrR family transcriptional regulator
MPRVRDEAIYEDMQTAIKDIARQQMATEGTAAVSLRGIARALDVTAPALYRYYASADDLITALIADGFNSLGDAQEATAAQMADAPVQARLLALLMAYRAWALDHAVDFQLIYGNPIPGYVAPREITVPAVIRTFVPMVTAVEQALQSRALIPQQPYDVIPPQVMAHEQAMISQRDYPISILSFHLTMILWSQLHGIIMLELYNHIGANVGDVEAFYSSSLRALLKSMGLRGI